MAQKLSKSHQLHKMFLVHIQGKIHFMVSALLLVSSQGEAYEINTHIKITEQAITQTANDDSFVANFRLNANQAKSSIKNGSNHEDDLFPLLRPRHHFYDPVTGAGLNLNGFSVGKSSLSWGFKDDTFLLGNSYSWTEARDYMYNGFTANSDSIRDLNFQKMFRSVGQVMHLVQDLATPAHVRNDSHIKLPNSLVRDLYENYALTHYQASWGTGYPTVSLDNFSDPWISSSGLSFFTNQNFISQDTNFFILNSTVQTLYPSPRLDRFTSKTEFLNIYNGTAFPIEVDCGGNTIQDLNTGETIINDKLTAYSVFDFEAQQILGERVFSINDYTMESAANILIRRAVGYSAGLLDYFFRGKMRVFGTRSGLVVQNASDEVMSFYDDPVTGEPIGSIEIYYDNVSGQRQLLATYDLPGPIDPNQGTPVIPFIRPSDNDVPDQYMVVFRGKLGAEEGAVIGQIFQRGIYYVGTENAIQKIYRINLDGSNRTLILKHNKS